MNNSNNTRNLTKDELFRKIQELSFVKTELELFLDTHPDSRVAMDYYEDTVDALDDYMEEYHDKYGPIHAKAGVRDSGWAWVDKPWPWQLTEILDELEVFD